MSRIILSRHDNGEERITVGFDRPLGHLFWSEYDDEGESIDESFINRGLRPHTIDDFIEAARTHNESVFNVMMSEIDRVAKELQYHMTLDYPASNVMLDLTRREQ